MNVVELKQLIRDIYDGVEVEWEYNDVEITDDDRESCVSNTEALYNIAKADGVDV